MVDDLTGRVLAGVYRVERKIGEGGMGAVYEAVDLRLGRRVAVKVLVEVEPKLLARFAQEAVATAQLASPNIVAVTDFRATEGEPPFLVMELLVGESLRARMKRAPRLPVREATKIAVDLLGALAVAHEAGIVHRDVKPPNVFLVRSGAKGDALVKLLDFGIAKVKSDLAKVHTTKGTLIGTPAYFAPEQLLEGELDGRTDVHAVGVLLFEMLAGERPFEADNPVDLTAAILHASPRPLSDLRADIPVELAAAVASALSKERVLRPTAEELAARLAPFAASTPAPPVAPVIVVPKTADPRPPASPARPPSPEPPRAGRRLGLVFGLVVAGAIGAGAASLEREDLWPSDRLDAGSEPAQAAESSVAAPPVSEPGVVGEADADAEIEGDDVRAPDPVSGEEDDERRTRLYKARVAGLRNEPGVVRDLLYPTVMAGGADPEEARLLREACKLLGDRACAAAVREKYPPPDAGDGSTTDD